MRTVKQKCVGLSKQKGRKQVCDRARTVLDVNRRVTWVIPQSNTCLVFQKHFSYGKCKSTVCFEKLWRTKINVNGSKWRIFYSSKETCFSRAVQQRKQLLEISDAEYIRENVGQIPMKKHPCLLRIR